MLGTDWGLPGGERGPWSGRARTREHGAARTCSVERQGPGLPVEWPGEGCSLWSAGPAESAALPVKWEGAAERAVPSANTV